MNNAAKQEPWAPDDCPPDVVELINIENQLGALGLRGLGSADSKEIRAGFRRLTDQLRANYLRGRRNGFWIGATAAITAQVAIAIIGWQLA